MNDNFFSHFMNFAHIVKFVKRYLICNGFRAYCMRIQKLYGGMSEKNTEWYLSTPSLRRQFSNTF